MSPLLEVGQPAPSFSLESDNAGTITLESLRGKYVVLYFYPKDDTPGCTREACAFRDDSAALAQRGAVVLGVSPDGVASHARFRTKYSLDFGLLADPDHAVAEAYGAWREKNMYGKKSMGIARSTFIIAPDGTLAKVWNKVSVDGHAAQVLAALDGLRA
jgi:thioredoxin-dependent peroxiredoxin